MDTMRLKNELIVAASGAFKKFIPILLIICKVSYVSYVSYMMSLHLPRCFLRFTVTSYTNSAPNKLANVGRYTAKSGAKINLTPIPVYNQ